MITLKRILLVSDAFYLLSGGLLGPIYALFVQSIGGDLFDAGSTFALFMLTAGIVVFLLALWEDKSKHQKKFVIAGYGIGTLRTTRSFQDQKRSISPWRGESGRLLRIKEKKLYE